MNCVCNTSLKAPYVRYLLQPICPLICIFSNIVIAWSGFSWILKFAKTFVYKERFYSLRFQRNVDSAKAIAKLTKGLTTG